MTSRPVSIRGRVAAVAALTAVGLVPFGATPFAAASAPTVASGSSAGAAPTAAPAAAPAAPVGKLTPSSGSSGCTVTPASGTAPELVACELWARAGTTQVLGTPVPVWGYATSATGTPTATGPTLVVRRGDRVTVTVHNDLTEPTALALPGQRAEDFSGVAPGTTPGGATDGIAAGGSGSYTFTASRPGTFLYEAGHTPDGARQAALGLAGALVVLDDGTAYGHAYDDEAVLVLSEIDPALNAHPTTFDMRDFAPRYRLINGKPFPSSDPVPTDQGHTVLLRYVNVGAQLHAMSVLGGPQTLLSEDGHPLANAEPAVVASVDPGVTTDSLVTMPTGPESKVAVYESAAQLDNAGQTTADPTALAFGGMLTYLDTNAPPPSSDAVGPASTQVTAVPNPSDGTTAVTVTATVSDTRSGGSAVDRAELVVDDPVSVGPGFGQAMTGAFGAQTVSASTQIPASATPAACAATPPPLDLHCLTPGKHSLFVRGHDAAGNWGVIGSVILNLAKAGPQTTGLSVTPSPANGRGAVTINATGDDSAEGGTVVAAEYFLGATAGAPGTGTTMTLNRQASKVAESASVPAATVLALGEGTAKVWVRSRNAQNLWGAAAPVDLPVDLTAPGVNASSVGPNPTNGVVSAKSYPGYLVISADLVDRDAGGAPQSRLVAGEAFVDPSSTTPTAGTGLTLIAVDGAFDSSAEQVYALLPLTQVRAMTTGEHKVYVHGKDAAGNWGSLTAPNALVRLFVDRTAPVLGTATASPNPTAGAATLTITAPVTESVAANYSGPRFQAAEYWTGTTDPGAGKATRVQVTDTGSAVSASIPLAGLLPGVTQFNLRVQDAAGNWSNVAAVSVTVQRANAIFSDTFDSGNLSAWSQSVGNLGVTPAAGIPVATGNFGLAATLPGGSGNAAAFVTDNTPAAETSYHAQFMFDPNTLSSGTGTTTWLTVFEGRTATGQAFSIQYHRVPNGQRQLRITMARSGFLGTLTGPAVNLAAGAHRIRVDWRQGPATGTAAGQTVLSVDGATVSTLQGANNTTALTVEAARLGITAGTSTTATGMAGTAWFDAFVSTRVSIP